MAFMDFVQDIGTYEARKVAKVEPEDNGGVGVSTAHTSDEGYETALLDANGTHPVQRYKSKKDARAGHEKWVEFAAEGDGKVINKLFWSEFEGMEEKVILEAVA